ncbi:MAG: endonuclease, partial [Candidatus Eisenbacteria bacterium]
IEIFNSGPDPVDLTSWSVVAIANNVDVTTWPLSGMLLAGQAKVCGGPSTVTGFTVHFQSSVWATAAGYGNWNGKIGDGAKLKNAAGTIVDLVVAPGTLFENADLVRIPSVTVPNPVYTASEWTSTPVQLATNASPGTHNGSAPPATGPIISNVVTDPATPAAGVPTDVQANAVDTSGAIVAVTLQWGTSASSLPNNIGMPLLTGDTYRTSASIPAQAGGASIYYRVTAEGPTQTNQSSVFSYTIAGGGGGIPPSVLSVGEMSDSTLLVIFSEPVDEASAEVPTNYTVGALSAVDAVRDPVQIARVLITVRGIPAGSRSLTVNAVADTSGDVAFGATRAFNYVDVTIPAGYYNSTVGLTGSALRVALHNIIKNHTSISYTALLTAFQTTDVKWNGKVWDVYSDIPGGTAPYEYSFGQTGQGTTEGLGYNREHSFPQSWFGGLSPMYSDLYHLYPTDSKVNGYRANYAFGTVGTATTTSLNGSKLGSSVSPGFTGTVFEPIDGFKGDLARGQFYMATRYFGEDAGWPGSTSFSGAEPLPWARAQYVQWCASDAVSWKERMRNGAVYVIQNNRNPFVDHPEFVAMVFDTTSTLDVIDVVDRRTIRLRQSLPNPFGTRTRIGFDLARRERVQLGIYDVTGRLVRQLTDGSVWEAGTHELEWNGQDDGGAVVSPGLYFCRLDADATSETRRIVFTR